MRKFGIWFNPDHLSKVSLSDFVKNHKHLNLSDAQLTEVWESKNPKKTDESIKDRQPKK